MEIAWFLSNLFLLPVYGFLYLLSVPVINLPLSLIFTLLLSPVPGFFMPLIYSGVVFTVFIKVISKIRKMILSNHGSLKLAILFSFYSTMAVGILINYNGTIFNYQYGRFFINLGSPFPFNGYSIWPQSFPFLTFPLKEIPPYYNVIHLPYFVLDWILYFMADIAVLFLANNRGRLISKLRKVALSKNNTRQID